LAQALAARHDAAVDLFEHLGSQLIDVHRNRSGVDWLRAIRRVLPPGRPAGLFKGWLLSNGSKFTSQGHWPGRWQ
jgi:hypothetical protein